MDKSNIERRLELERMMGVDALIHGYERNEKEERVKDQEKTEGQIDGGGEPDEDSTTAQQLQQVAEEVAQCTNCRLHQTRTNPVFARGRVDAELMFIGEGPGADEDREGVPFVGRAGKLLDKMIAAMGLARDEVYITNIIKSRPPQNRDPRADEVEACWPYLERQIELVAPDIIATLGKPASNTLLGRDSPMYELRGNWHRYKAIPVMPTYHPAYLLRDPRQKEKVWQDLREVIKALHGDVPEELNF